MTQFNTEGAPAFPVENTESSNSAESSPGEQTGNEQTQSNEGEQTQSTPQANEEGQKDANAKGGDHGFADHPAWTEREESWKSRFNDQETRHTEELTKLQQTMPEQISKSIEEALKKAGVGQSNDSNTPVDIPGWFGGDEDQWKSFSNDLDTRIGRVKQEAKEEALGEINSKSESEQAAIKEATDYLNTEILALETDRTINPHGEKVERNKLLKYTMDNDLVDSKGRWNYKAAYQLMKAGVSQSATKSNDDRKKLAGATTNDTKVEAKPQPYLTSEDFDKPGNRPW